LITAGDEFGHTQQSNNNAYCQDSELSWLDWENADTELHEFVRQLIRLRKRHPGFRRRSYAKAEDVTWLTPQGQPMQHEDWTRAETRALGLLLLGKRLAERDDHGAPVEDDDLLLLLNAGSEAVEFVLPDSGWQRLLDTFAPTGTVTNPYFLGARALALLVKPR